MSLRDEGQLQLNVRANTATHSHHMNRGLSARQSRQGSERPWRSVVQPGLLPKVMPLSPSPPVMTSAVSLQPLTVGAAVTSGGKAPADSISHTQLDPPEGWVSGVTLPAVWSSSGRAGQWAAGPCSQRHLSYGGTSHALQVELIPSSISCLWTCVVHRS